MRDHADWEVEGRDWPHRQASRFLTLGPVAWHVQVLGNGPVLLLLHGTGAASHSWRGVADILARDFTLVIPDLPGQGFSRYAAGYRPTLPRLAADLAGLLGQLEQPPLGIVGHSAGAAIALRMVLDGSVHPRAVASINGALEPLGGAAALVFPALARLLFLNPLALGFLSWRAGDLRAVARVIEGTGSRLDAAGLDFYARLLRTRGHLAGTLAMMADWDPAPLWRDLRLLPLPVALVAAAADRAVPPQAAVRAAARLPQGRVIPVPALGHLAHEEDPGLFATLIRDALGS
ncbi:alpha/beta fold hydrolase BchO [Zavarzinia sp. CC-PAN008]|uniref:alpha/beta fold hydrolase BchO n=1 Tax=Zavarzinia sp. CC-PAN008 TaxID=3243332 RepID=UPI003F744DA1